MSHKYDVAVIGAGPGGYVAAIRCSQLKLKTALVERNKLGGVCLNCGCIPTKSLLKSAEIVDIMRNAEKYGLNNTECHYDINNIVARAKNISNKLASGIDFLVKKNNITLYNAEAKFIDSNNLILTNDQTQDKIYAKHFIIATGARPRTIPGLEADGKLIWNYEHALTPKEIPKNLLIIGSGAIGIEFATFYNIMGSKVTVAEIADRILINEDKEIADMARKEFTKQGMQFITNATVTIVKRGKDYVEVSIDNGKIKQLRFDKIIVAAGVVPNTEDIGLGNIKVGTNKNVIVTNDYNQTSVPHIYAIGDVTDGPWLAHKASAEAVRCADHISGNNVVKIDKNNIPSCVYSLPQIASIGMTEEQAIAQGYNTRIGRSSFSSNGKALASGHDVGMVKTIFNSDNGEILGISMIGYEVSEMIQILNIAKLSEVSDEDIAQAIFAHPTASETIYEAVLDALARRIH